MKQIILGLIFLLAGALTSLGIFFNKNRLVSESVINIPGNGFKFEPTPFSLENAPSQALKGKITQRDGEIWWQSRTATEAAKLQETIDIQQGEILIASESGNLTVEFSPAATVALFPETKVEIVQTLPLNLVFNQPAGIGQYQTTGQSPVTIRSHNLIVDLADGLLVIDTDEAAGTIILGLKTGSAKVGYNSPEFASKVWGLEPGDVFEYDSNLRQGYFK